MWLLQPGFLSARAQQLSAIATVDSTSYLVGDWITVHVDLTHPKGATFQPELPDTLGPFLVVNRLPFTPVGEGRTTTAFAVAKYDSGTATLPSVRYLCTIPGDTAIRTVETGPLRLSVHTLAVDTSKGIKDLKPPLSVPYTLEEILTAAALVLAVALLLFFGWRYYRKRMRQAGRQVYVPPPRPAHVIALEELGLLKERKLWQQGRIKEYYSAVTEIVRRYFENRYEIPALEETTDEIIDGLLRVPVRPQVLMEMEKVLRRADLVKFAKHQPSMSEHEEMMTVAYAVVEMTKAVPPQLAPAGETKGGTHVES
jgi:hypothetical protein